MSNSLEAIHLLETKLKNLLENYDFLIKENEILLKNNQLLQYKLSQEEQKQQQLVEEYKLLKIAKTIEGSNKSTRDTKLKINALVREIDKCIALLNE